MHADGGGLWLQVTGGGRSWIFRYTRQGRTRDMGLGSLSTYSLAEAREAARRARQQLGAGIDPIEARRAERDARALIPRTTFAECAEEYIAANEAQWRNAKHREQWRSTLKTYAYPTFGRIPVAEIDTPLVLRALQRDKLWTSKTETATRVRQRVEAVLDFATVNKLRSGDNPARWQGHLEHSLPRPTKVKKVQHHAAMPFAKVASFMAALQAQPGAAARALELAILTAARTGEVIGARWDEVDIAAKVWTVPAERMKAGRAHHVPLSLRALAILKEMKGQGSDYIFPGAREGKPLSNMALLAVLKRMGRNDVTTHGFRSTFRDWCAEATNYPRDVAEMALAHVVKDKTEAAYRRGDLFEKRRALMADWALHCFRDGKRAVKVVPLRRLV